jgi:hypothetical protein
MQNNLINFKKYRFTQWCSEELSQNKTSIFNIFLILLSNICILISKYTFKIFS